MESRRKGFLAVGVVGVVGVEGKRKSDMPTKNVKKCDEKHKDVNKQMLINNSVEKETEDGTKDGAD